MKTILVGASLFFAAPAFAQAVSSRIGPLVVPASRLSLERGGSLLGLSRDAAGALRYARRDPETGATVSVTLSPAATARVTAFLAKLPEDRPEPALARALQTYLALRPDAKDPLHSRFMKEDGQGSLALTELGRNVLLDILTAEDGLLLTADAETAPETPRSPGRLLSGRSPLDESGALASARRAIEGGAAFDGTRHAVAEFDWDALERELSVPGLKAFQASALRGYTVDREANTVRVLVAADRAVRADRLKVGASAAEQASVLQEADLDRELLSRHGATVVRAVDNLIALDVPLDEAASLGKALGARGVAAAPARLFRAMAPAAAPVAGLLGGQFLPLPSSVLGGASPALVDPKNLDARARMDVEQLWGRGMQGAGTVVGIIDSGIDAEHPDFQGRIAGYRDFTEEGRKDPVGHGTHVAGSVGGSGAASEGQYKGMAPGTRLLVAKVFGVKGEASEDVILAAMKWMASAEEKPDVVNMSLGGPGDPNADPLSSMANRLMVRDNILMVTAAGNEGPRPGTVGSPGSARYALTVTGVNRKGQFSFFPSRGPVTESDGDSYTKPDLTTIAGDITLTAQEAWWKALILPSSARAEPADGNCIYGPGVVSTRSSDDEDAACAVAGNPRYRFMTGTSMATPMAAGVGADVIGYLKSEGAAVRSAEVKAALMETASDLGQAREVQGSGLLDGRRLAEAVVSRVQQGLPVGNVAYVVAMRLTSSDRERLKNQDRYEETALGLLDTRTGHLVNTDAEMEAALRELRRKAPVSPADIPVARHEAPELSKNS